MDTELTLEKLKIADRLSVLETHFSDKMDFIYGEIKESRVVAKAVDVNFNLMAMNLQKRISELPCCVHKNELKWIKGGLYTMYILVAGLIVKAIEAWVQK